MNPEIWGEHAWIFLHSITLAYPKYPTKDDKENMKNFIYSLQFILPCNKCKKNFSDHLIKYPLTDTILSSKETLVKWLHNLHNIVNIQNNKKTISYYEMLKKYDDLYNKKNNLFYILISLILIILIILIVLW